MEASAQINNNLKVIPW